MKQDGPRCNKENFWLKLWHDRHNTTRKHNMGSTAMFLLKKCIAQNLILQQFGVGHRKIVKNLCLEKYAN